MNIDLFELFSAMYGAFFSKNAEAAFSNNLLWWCLGLTIGYGYSSVLCTKTKLLILFMSLLIGNICYFVIEYIDYKEKSIVVEINEENSTMISEVKMIPR